MDAGTVRDAFSTALGPEWDVSVTRPGYLGQWVITATYGRRTCSTQWSTLMLDMPGRLEELAEAFARRVG
ncbi:hypothetical protein [Actinomycetospora lutea]|uniref:hypothetical protein n=1 Tax=Actinomycetospora lutea TaxID=663604 RepID=UPI002365C73B|nr:hypothetical protein [Actinomycetospora lutea]